MRIRSFFVAVFLWSIAHLAFAQAASTAAQGDSTFVNLYGDVDIGPTYVSNVGGKSKIFMDSSEYRSDKWGIRGQEYLGSGLAVVFKLEGEYFLNDGATQLNGAKGPGFTSQTYVGLSSRDYGTVTMGRQLNLSTDTVCFSSACYGGVYSFHEGSLERVGFDTDNAIRYESPNFGGLRFKVQYGFTDPVADVGHALQGEIAFDTAGASVKAIVQQTADAPNNIYANLGVTSLLGIPITAANPTVTFDRLTVAGIGGAFHMVGQFHIVALATYVRMQKGDNVASMPTYDGGVVWNNTANNTLVLTATYDVESLDSIEADFYTKGVTDGLPIIPPTRERVEAMIRFNGLDPRAVIASKIPPRNGVATVEKIAINAVMAGCLPEYLPVVIAAVEGLTAPGFDLFGLQATTHPAALAVIISGPISRTLDINSGSGALGPGWRANATIGRAVRLIALNLGGAKPGPVDKSTQGSPAKYGFCFAENEEANPWEAFHVERGFKPEDSTVTVLGLEGPHNINGQDSLTAADLLKVISNSIISMGSCNFRFTTGSDLFIGLGPEHAHILARDGLSKNDIREYLFEHARVPVSKVPQEHIAHRLKTPAQYGDWDGKSDIRIVKAKENFLLGVVGGPGLHSCWMPNWGGPNHRAVTKLIRPARS